MSCGDTTFLICYDVDLCFWIAHTGVFFGTSLPGNSMHPPWESFPSIFVLLHPLFDLVSFVLSFLLSLFYIVVIIVILFIIPFPLFPLLHSKYTVQLCSIYNCCLVSIFYLSSLQPISPQSPFQHLVFSLYHHWSTFHAGLLHGLMPSLCFYAVCVLFVSPTRHSKTHCFV